MQKQAASKTSPGMEEGTTTSAAGVRAGIQGRRLEDKVWERSLVDYDGGVMPGLDVEVETNPMAEVLDKLWALYRQEGFAGPYGQLAREEFNAMLQENAFQLLPLAQKGLAAESAKGVLAQAREELLMSTPEAPVHYDENDPVMGIVRQIDELLKKL
jgi:hypothetical protein